MNRQISRIVRRMLKRFETENGYVDFQDHARDGQQLAELLAKQFAKQRNADAHKLNLETRWQG